MLDITFRGGASAHVDRARLVSVARRIMRNHEDAEDCVQRALLSATLHGAAVDDVEPWLATVVVNVCRMELRARRRKRRDTRCTVHEVDEAMRDPSPGPHELVEARELQASIARAVGAWPARDVAVLAAVIEDDVPYADLAPRFALTRSAFKTRVSRIRKRLRETIEPADASTQRW